MSGVAPTICMKFAPSSVLNLDVKMSVSSASNTAFARLEAGPMLNSSKVTSGEYFVKLDSSPNDALFWGFSSINS